MSSKTCKYDRRCRPKYPAHDEPHLPDGPKGKPAPLSLAQ